MILLYFFLKKKKKKKKKLYSVEIEDSIWMGFLSNVTTTIDNTVPVSFL